MWSSITWISMLIASLVSTGPSGQVLIVCDKNERPPMEALARFLENSHAFRCAIVNQSNFPPDLALYRVVFMYVHAVLQPEVESGLISYARQGGRLIVLHHGLASAKRQNPIWLRAMGVSIPPSEGVERPWKVLRRMTFYLVNVQPGHYVTSHDIIYDTTVSYTSSETPTRNGQFPAFQIQNSEVFLNQKFTDGDAKTVLFCVQCQNPETGERIMQDRGGWMKPLGRGWVFYFQTGHCKEDYENPRFRQVLLNAALWSPWKDSSLGF